MTMLEDIDKNTVAFVPNFDDRLKEPTVLPGRLPTARQRLGGHRGGHDHQHPAPQPERSCAGGGAPGGPSDRHAQGHPEVSSKAPISRPGQSSTDATASRSATRKVAGVSSSGPAPIAEEKESTGKQQIVVTEFPYQVSPERVHEQIRDLALAKKLEGISDVRNESDKEGIRLVIELKRDVIPWSCSISSTSTRRCSRRSAPSCWRW